MRDTKERYIKLELKNIQRSPFRMNNCHAVHPTPSKLHPPPCVLAPGGNNRHPQLPLSLSLSRARAQAINPRDQDDRERSTTAAQGRSPAKTGPKAESRRVVKSGRTRRKRRNKNEEDRRTQNARGEGWIGGSFNSRKI